MISHSQISSESQLSVRSREILTNRYTAIAQRTDRMFAWLMLVQWVALILWAWQDSAYTWWGANRTIHPHLWLAIFGGGLTASLPILLARRAPGTRATRHVIAIAQITFSTLFIHISGGRIETHFHVFVSLAFLAAYRDWRVLVTATIVVLLDHVIRGTFWPQSVFGVIAVSPWRWVEHAAWVLFEDAVLMFTIGRNLQDMEENASQTAELQLKHGELERSANALGLAMQRTQAIIEGALDGVVQLDSTGRITGWNRQAEKIFGWPMDDALGQPLIQLTIPAADRDSVQQGLDRSRKVVAGEAAAERFEVSGQRQNGQVFPVELSIVSCASETGTAYCLFVRDITTRRQAEADLRRARDHAEAASEAKSQFLANVSHEIRTPLNGILGFADLIIRKPNATRETVNEYLRTIKQCGEHLLSLINDILDISKIEAGHLEVTALPCSPYEIVAGVMSVLRVKAQDKGISLEYYWNGDIPETIVTDPGRVRQLLINLVNNAVKFTLKGGVWVEARYDKRTGQLEFAVRDSGIGIPAEKLDQIFQPFVQVDNSITRHFEGTGLGLSICRRIVFALGGDIRVDSTPGQGSTFTATVNAQVPETAKWHSGVSSDLIRSRTKETPTDASALAGLRVLIVEDGETNRRLISAILEDVDIHVSMAENGAVGLQMASQLPFDVILMDMQMPVMDGYTAAGRMRSAGVMAPIIALTAHAMQGDAEKCFAAGCSDYLPKPIREAELLRKVAQVAGVTGTVSTPELITPPTDRRARIQSTLPLGRPRFRAIVRQFGERLHAELDQMENALAAADYPQLARQAHWLRGTGGTAGFDAFTRPAQTLEMHAQQQQGDQAQQVLQQIREIADLIELPESEEVPV
ncbi:hybrid sensor histidine kinase/response regulator [Planctomicrobium piriforme]|uniref:histidine kinase n=1 Tax=Planctomicrobium piriforme TaxID=1576369 RepID=A0A1I3GS75_9PLAN|nr:ATP-binding protein [Planctomicrobium piriforme]SFI26273.1 PAS domain S-box-containing protein [Planctomicrobium piriforme]